MTVLARPLSKKNRSEVEGSREDAQMAFNDRAGKNRVGRTEACTDDERSAEEQSVPSWISKRIRYRDDRIDKIRTHSIQFKPVTSQTRKAEMSQEESMTGPSLLQDLRGNTLGVRIEPLESFEGEKSLHCRQTPSVLRQGQPLARKRQASTQHLNPKHQSTSPQQKLSTRDQRA
jgi:hypothetical protein